MSVIVDTKGRALDANALAAHDAADLGGKDLAGWRPSEISADGSVLPELELLRSRTGDLVRNNGLLSGAVQTHLDNVVGTGLTLSAKPDWMALGLDADWAQEWQRQTEAQFRLWANDPDANCDSGRRLMFSDMIALAYRSFLTSFEILAVADWLPRRGAPFSTAIQIIDPARLSNPHGHPDSEALRGGIRLDAKGAATGYWFKSNMNGDPSRWSGAPEWKMVPRQTRWGRQRVCHIFEPQRPGQNRGTHGLVSILRKVKKLEKFEDATLDAAVLNAMYAAVIQSPMDWESVGGALGIDDTTQQYMGNRAKFHKTKGVTHNGVKIPHLYPGEELKFMRSEHPNAEFGVFQEGTLRYLAAGFGLTYEQLSRDYSKTNYSSARAAMLESWRLFSGMRKSKAGRFASWVYALWLEEAIDKGRVSMPPGAPSFYEAKAAWTQCEWIGPAKGHIDPLKEKKATELDLSLGLTTQEAECAAQGKDWEQVLIQRARETKRTIDVAEELGIDPQLLLRQQPKDEPNERPETDD